MGLAAVLVHSGQMTIGRTVAVPVLRGPAAIAKIFAAIDLLSGDLEQRRIVVMCEAYVRVAAGASSL